MLCLIALQITQLSSIEVIESIADDVHITTMVRDYIVSTPANLQPGDKGYPLIVQLHGTGGKGDDINTLGRNGPRAQAHKNPNFSFLVLTPRLKKDKGYDSFELKSFIDDLTKKYQVDMARVYLTGASLGGIETWRFASRYPELLAGIVPIAGTVSPYDEMTDVQLFHYLPVWAFHSEEDKTTKSKFTIKAVEKLQSMTTNPNGAPAQKHIYTQENSTIYNVHNCWDHTWNQNTDPQPYDWMQDQVNQHLEFDSEPFELPLGSTKSFGFRINAVGPQVVEATLNSANEDTGVTIVGSSELSIQPSDGLDAQYLSFAAADDLELGAKVTFSIDFKNKHIPPQSFEVVIVGSSPVFSAPPQAPINDALPKARIMGTRQEIWMQSDHLVDGHEVKLSQNGFEAKASIRVQEGFMARPVLIDQNTLLDSSLSSLFVSTQSSAVHIKLPKASQHSGRVYHIKKLDSANLLTLSCSADDLIDGQVQVHLASRDQRGFLPSLELISNGDNWAIVGGI